MGFFLKLGLVLWKNWLLRKRHYVVTAFELILPILFTMMLVILRSQGGSDFAVTYFKDPTYYPALPIDESADLSQYYVDSNQTYRVQNQPAVFMYSPPTNKYVVQIMKTLQVVVNRFNWNVTLEAVADDSEMEARSRAADIVKDETLFGGLSFINLPDTDTLPKTLHYKIRLRSVGNGVSQWQTGLLVPAFSNPSPKNMIGDDYLSKKFAALQNVVANIFLKLITDDPSVPSSFELYTQRFPYPPYYSDSGFQSLMQNMLPLFIVFSYIFISPTLIKRIVLEKELGTKELMKLMGLPAWIQWLGWFISSFIMMALSAILIVILLCTKFSLGTSVLAHSEPVLLFFILLLYVSSAIFFCFFISSLFSKPTLATALGILVWLMTYSVPYNTLNPRYEQLNLSEKLSVALFPNMALAWAIRLIASFESRNLGLQWNYLAEPSYKGDNLTMLHIIMMFVIDIFLYGALTWYIDHIYPGKFGVRKPWYFLFTKVYWVKPHADEEHGDLSTGSELNNIESEPFGMTPSIVIKHLTKCYGWQEDGKRAVDDLSLNFYEGQITALLGHNGAGKTTTMSMLTGMFAPTSGTASVNGYDIRTQIDSARENIGLCPQENMLFDELTVKEHLIFFGRLKQLKGKALHGDINLLMQKLQFMDKQNVESRSLSGGMKRKLNLGISLVGGAKVVILDEPTSGMDPEARRAIWDLLQELRPGRCIVLTTHFMEEADVLGDRIAIMAHGQVQCCGAPMFLKKRYGAGYHLNISKTENCNVERLTLLIQRYVPEAYVSSNVNTEMSFTLPSNKTSAFPEMFEELEGNLIKFGVSGFGVSVTTMEEVFLKVGETVEAEDNAKHLNGAGDHHKYTAFEASGVKPLVLNTGFQLMILQFWGLILKRFYYSRRRWGLIIGQIILPVIMIVMALLLNNTIDSVVSMEPSRLMDIHQYETTTSLVNDNTTAPHFWSDAYIRLFSSPAEAKNEINIDNFLIRLGEDNFQSYRENYVVAAKFTPLNSTITNITAMYNGIYYHTLPLSVNLAHNAILQRYTKSAEWKIMVENAPLPNDPGKTFTSDLMMKMLKSILMGIFIPVGLSFLSSSFVVFPIQERTSKSKHLQLMTGVGGILFWGVSFLWDFFIHLVSSLIILVAFASLDGTNVFTGTERLGIVFYLLLAYGWAAIPFSYMVSFICKLPASGYGILSVVNMIAGMILSLMVVFFQNYGNEILKDVGNALQWPFYFLPNYAVTVSFMKFPIIATSNTQCDGMQIDMLKLYCNQTVIPPEIFPCCTAEVTGNATAGCEPNCLKKIDYFGWDSPGLGQSLMMLSLDGIIYFLLLFLFERGDLYRLWYFIRNGYMAMKRRRNNFTVMDNETSVGIIDSDVMAEKNRIQRLFDTASPSDDALIVHDLTKTFWAFRAVDHLSFGVKNAECFGLLGINGAGKTTTFRMMTGDEIMTCGNAYLHGISLKQNRTQFLKQISYCPQFDALISHLTGRETLLFFGRLRGIGESDIRKTVNQYISMFDLSEHADKVTMAYSGGNKRKLSAAIAFIGNPPMVFLDEPTTGVDPVARRKLWDMLLAAKARGTSLILTSHSMEECEVLCSRLAIMVNGQFKCLGGIQHLKNKFGQGFMVIAKIKPFIDQTEQNNVQEHLQQFIEDKFPGCILKDVHQGMVHYHITDLQITWTYLFSTMEEAKATFHLEDYAVSQTSLEQVFLSFARQQKEISAKDTKNGYSDVIIASP